METNARYLTIGGFVLAVLVACLGFVLWINRTGGLSAQDVILARFGNQASGLQPGAAVLFNGMRVGSVSALVVGPQDLRRVVATLAVAAGTPVRQDTRVGVASQGLMGNAAVTLEGGDASSPPLAARTGVPPMLAADPAASRSLTESAHDTLAQVDVILADNAAPLKSTMDNLKVFSGALAKNAGRVDAAMAGLAQLAGGGPVKVPRPVYDLATPKLAPLAAIPSGQLVIDAPTSVVALQTQQLLARSTDGRLTRIGEMQWSDLLPNLLQQKIAQSLDDAKFVTTLVAPTSYGKDDRQLQLELRRFNVAAAPERAAEVVFSAKLLSGDGHVLGARLFEAKATPAGVDELASVQALNTAFRASVGELGAWIALPMSPATINTPALR